MGLGHKDLILGAQRVPWLSPHSVTLSLCTSCCPQSTQLRLRHSNRHGVQS